jgi:hypothetical protein
MQNEIVKAAEKLNIPVEDAQLKYEEICKENGVTSDSPMAIALWRSYAAQQIRNQKSGNETQKKGGLAKQAFGFFISLEEPRDLNEYNRRRAVEEWKNDPFNAHKSGFVAIVEEKENGFYSVSRCHNGEVQEKNVANLPECVQHLEDGSIIIPLDNQPRYQNGGENQNYGRPLNPVMRRSGIFIGKVDDDEDYTAYKFSYKNQGGIDFTPKTFSWLSMVVIKDSNRDGFIYGFTDKTIGSLRMNDDEDPNGDLYRNVSNINMAQLMAEKLPDNVAYLGSLEEKHVELGDRPSTDRFVITTGTVCNINMTATANGNRIINITDLQADFDYEEDGMTTCWIPQNIEIDFGIGSLVMVVGRTSQRETDEGLQPVTINTAGLLVVERRGQVVEISEATEENLDWF